MPRSLFFNGLEVLDVLLKIGFFTLGDAPVFVTVVRAAGRSNDDPYSTDALDSFVKFNADLFGVDPGLSNSLRSFSFYRNHRMNCCNLFFDKNTKIHSYLIVHAHR